MISRNLYFQIVYRVLLIVILSLATGCTIALNGSIVIAFICLIIEIPVVINLISYLNTTNRKMSYFLESIQNNDSALLFPTNVKSKYVRELYQGLNKINEQIKKLKIENLQREQYFQTLLEHVPTGIVTFNTKGFVHHANSSAKKMMSVEVLTHVNQLERINHNLFNTVLNIKPFEQKMVSLANERGTIELSLKATSFKIRGAESIGQRAESGEPCAPGPLPSATKDDDLILLSIQDIRNELDEKELDSWMKLIRVLMHEIMNSITPITSLSESLSKFLIINGRPALLDEIGGNAIQSTLQGLNVINEQGKGLMLFVESYRKLTRLPIPDKKVFKVDDLVNRLKVLYFSLEHSENVRLIVMIDPPEMELFADENLISQVLLNLVKNALESIESREQRAEGREQRTTSPDGKIHLLARITGQRTEGREHYAPCPLPFATNKGAEICVIDNGPGISNEIIEQIFMPFFTTRANGSGIGLSLSRQIMRLHGGSLQARSIPNKETIFSMIF